MAICLRENIFYYTLGQLLTKFIYFYEGYQMMSKCSVYFKNFTLLMR